MTSIEVVLKAYDVLEAALVAGGAEAAVDAIRPELEVLPREELLRVAIALAVEVTVRLSPLGDGRRLLDRVQRARLRTMWAGS